MNLFAKFFFVFYLPLEYCWVKNSKISYGLENRIQENAGILLKFSDVFCFIIFFTACRGKYRSAVAPLVFLIQPVIRSLKKAKWIAYLDEFGSTEEEAKHVSHDVICNHTADG